jgi:hypothetical protein
MASLPATGGSPITFLNSNFAQQSIPLTFVTFPSATGTPTVSSAWPDWKSPADQANVASWVQYLATQGLLAADIVPLPPAAFTITARDAGSSGNDITIAFGAVTPNTATPSATTVDVTVSTKQVYPALTPTSIATVLGTAPLAGTQPGLAYVSAPLTGMPTAVTTPKTFSGSPLAFVPPGSGGALSPTHDAASEAADAALLQATITNVTTTTFDLTLIWSKEQTVPLSSLPATFAYLVTIAPPPGGFVYAPAANSQITLVGGADPTSIPPSQAEAAVPPG